MPRLGPRPGSKSDLQQNLAEFYPSEPGLDSLTVACCPRLQVLLGLPRPLQPGGGASVPGSGVVLSEGSAGSAGGRGQHDITAGVGPLVVFVPGEPEVSLMVDCLTGRQEWTFLSIKPLDVFLPQSAIFCERFNRK